MPRIVILTGSELRHVFFRKAVALSSGIETLLSVCEGQERSLRRTTEAGAGDNSLRLRHVAMRDRAEEDFFGAFAALAPDRSNPVFTPDGGANDPALADTVARLNPDLLVAYGCSIIREPLLSSYAGRFLNVHLGLSPYRRGAGTNFWPLVDGEPEYVGATFMHIDAGIDTGAIIHQIRPRIFPGDDAHRIGNRLIADMTIVYAEIVRRFDVLPAMPQPKIPADAQVYRQKDFSENATRRLYEQFADGLVERYLAERERRCARVPIVENPALRGVLEDWA